MPKKSGYKRYWRMVDGVVERTTSYETMGDDWLPGIGPIDPEVRSKWVATLSATHAGKPKGETQKERMRKAKLGVEKSPEHKASMSATHKARWAKIRQLKEDTGVTFKEARDAIGKKK